MTWIKGRPLEGLTDKMLLSAFVFLNELRSEGNCGCLMPNAAIKRKMQLSEAKRGRPKQNTGVRSKMRPFEVKRDRLMQNAAVWRLAAV